MSTIEKAINKLVNSAAGKGAVIPNQGETVVEGVSHPRETANAYSGSGRYVELDLPALSSLGMVTPHSPAGLIAEEFRIIKRPLLKNSSHSDDVDRSNIILVTSSVAGEGKTFTSVNLAMSIAMELDRTVLLVDADVTKQGVSEILGFDPGEGLTDILAKGEKDLSSYLIKTNVPKFTMLSSGRRYSNVTELFSSQSMFDLFNELAARYSDRIIIIDAPPLLETSEARVLVGLVGQVAMVVEAEKTPRALVAEAVGHLDKNKITGFVLNKSLRAFRGGYGGYGGGYGYSRKR